MIEGVNYPDLKKWSLLACESYHGWCMLYKPEHIINSVNEFGKIYKDTAPAGKPYLKPPGIKVSAMLKKGYTIHPPENSPWKKNGEYEPSNELSENIPQEEFKYILTTPKKVSFLLYDDVDLEEYIEEFDLNIDSMIKILTGKQKTHKGYFIKYNPEYDPNSRS